MKKDLKRLSRTQLLELLLEQTKRVEQLEEDLADARQRLDQRKLQIQKAGNLAQAVLEINGVMEAAQKSAQQYLDNIVAMEAETQATCQRLIREAHEEATKIKLLAQCPK